MPIPFGSKNATLQIMRLIAHQHSKTPTSTYYKQFTRITQQNSSDIWKLSNEQFRVKQYWTSLTDAQRQQLLVVDWNDVLCRINKGNIGGAAVGIGGRMCSCHVCGRKRVVVEEVNMQ